MIVPVVVHHMDHPHVEVSVCALLDDGSDSTFVTNSTLRELGLEGTAVSLKLNTMHGKERIPAQKVEGLIVQRLHKQTVVELPKAYSKELIPARRNQIPTPEIAGEWQHLTKIKDEIPPIQHDVEVDLLIGCNCPKTLKPQEVILGNDNDPYPVKTKLGWGIIGPVSPSSLNNEDDASFCHRIVTCEVGNKRRDGIFIVDNQTKDVINPFEVRRMFEMNFSEQYHYVKEFSQEDRKFLEIVKCGISLQDGHYEHYPRRTEICYYQTTAKWFETDSIPSRNDLNPAKHIASTTVERRRQSNW